MFMFAPNTVANSLEHIKFHHHQHIICYGVVSLVFFFFFSWMKFFIRQKETAQHLSTKCRFCSNSASYNLNMKCNIPFPIRNTFIPHCTVMGKFPLNSQLEVFGRFRYAMFVWNMPVCVYILSFVHFVDNSISYGL